ncbi:unnamed protein product [Clavelina lepadiformis]|uniref:Uncharacterized protein n=1 Tax=Clavelina lepadiformis TaxID=159417 RepID=A0ABP0FEP5_CLALP
MRLICLYRTKRKKGKDPKKNCTSRPNDLVYRCSEQKLQFTTSQSKLIVVFVFTTNSIYTSFAAECILRENFTEMADFAAGIRTVNLCFMYATKETNGSKNVETIDL